MITIQFDSIDELNSFVASAFGTPRIAPPAPTFDAFDPTFAPAHDSLRTQAVEAGGHRINSEAVYDNMLSVGDAVSWSGAKFSFDGVVDKLNLTSEADDDDKVVFIRRNDTGKLVSLTNDDLDNYSLVKLAA